MVDSYESEAGAKRDHPLRTVVFGLNQAQLISLGALLVGLPSLFYVMRQGQVALAIQRERLLRRSRAAR